MKSSKNLTFRMINEVVSILIDYRGKTPKKTKEGIKLITAKVIKNGRIIDENEEYIAEADFYLWMRRGIPRKWDVLITTEAPLGEVAIIKSSERFALAQRVILLRGNLNLICQMYLFYALRSHFVQEELYSRATGTTVLGIKQSELKQVSIPYFHLPIQHKIAAILSAYDDLIENNTRRIKLLEEMAHMLYREWFVHFRFPGHEKVKFVESELGRIPEGWEVRKFTDIVDIMGGGTPKTNISEYWDGDIPFFAPKDTPPFFYVTQTEKNITNTGLSKCSSRLYPKDTVFITARGTVGKIVMAALDMAMNQSCYALRGKASFSQQFIFMSIKNQIDFLKKNTGGATFETIVTDTFKGIKIITPPTYLIENFTKKIEPIFQFVLNLINKNTKLAETRDLLLPKLISGEIDVNDLNIKGTEPFTETSDNVFSTP